MNGCPNTPLDRGRRITDALHELCDVSERVEEAFGNPETFLEMCVLEDIGRTLRAVQRFVHHELSAPRRD